jgi:hypothetical protein
MAEKLQATVPAQPGWCAVNVRLDLLFGLAVATVQDGVDRRYARVLALVAIPSGAQRGCGSIASLIVVWRYCLLNRARSACALPNCAA